MFVSNSAKLCPTKIDVEWPKSNSKVEIRRNFPKLDETEKCTRLQPIRHA